MICRAKSTEAELARALAEHIDPHGYPALTAVHAAETAGDQIGRERADVSILLTPVSAPDKRHSVVPDPLVGNGC